MGVRADFDIASNSQLRYKRWLVMKSLEQTAKKLNEVSEQAFQRIQEREDYYHELNIGIPVVISGVGYQRVNGKFRIVMEVEPGVFKPFQELNRENKLKVARLLDDIDVKLKSEIEKMILEMSPQYCIKCGLSNDFGHHCPKENKFIEADGS